MKASSFTFQPIMFTNDRTQRASCHSCAIPGSAATSMEAPARFALAVVRMHRWRSASDTQPVDEKMQPDDVEFFQVDDGDAGLSKDDMIMCGRLLMASLGTTQAASTLRGAGASSDEGSVDDDDEEEEIFNREVDAAEFRDCTRPESSVTAKDDDGIFFRLPRSHRLHDKMQGIGAPDPRFRRTFYVQQEVRFVVLVSNVPFQPYLKGRLLEVASEFFAQCTGDGSRVSYGDLAAFYRRLTGSINFAELPYRNVHVGLPVVNIIKRFGKDVIAILRVLMLEGRIMCFSNNSGLAASATLALLALLPGVLSANAEFTPRTIHAAMYRARRYGMPFSLLHNGFALQPCFTKDQADLMYDSPGFLVGTSDPLLSKHPNAKLDLIVDLDSYHLVAIPTVKSEYSFGFGASTAAFVDSLSERFGRNIASPTSADSVPDKLKPTKRTFSGRAFPRVSMMRRKSTRMTAEPALSDIDWVLAQFQVYFEHFLDEGMKGVFQNCGSDADGYDPYTPSLLSRLGELAAPMFGEHSRFYAEYGRGWILAWQKTRNFEKWLSAQRSGRRRSTSTTEKPGPPHEGQATYTYPNGDEYEGDFKNGKRHGFGIYVEYLTKTQYEGDWVEDKRHGKGILSSKVNGYIYDGEWRDDVRCGRGQSSLKNVENYAGEWLDNRFHGMGVYSNADGDVYDGEWKCGEREGMGKLTCGAVSNKNGEEFGGLKQFVGEWRRGLFHGTGTAQYGDGTQYSGEFQDSRRHGTGLMLYAIGDRYDGQWWKGYRHGEGSFFSAKSGITKEGAWRKGSEVDGTWFLVYPNGDKFTGECQRGRPWGHGICKYANGSSYSGEWVDGLREGFGVLVNTDGTMMEGEWSNSAFVRAVRAPSRFVDIPLSKAPGSPRRRSGPSTDKLRRFTLTRSNHNGSSLPPLDGAGVHVYANGDRYEGDFKNHERHGFGMFTERATGSVYEGEWRHDQKQGQGVLTSGMKDFIYDGKWEHDVRSGYGHCVIRDCETYSGHWRANQFHGIGKYIDAEGNVYDGEFADGKKHGMGKQTFTSRREEYSGEWKQGRRDGIGDATFADGSTYCGGWKSDLPDGEGAFTSGASGERYTGQWRGGVREGTGVLHNPTTGVTKEGTWVADEPVDGDWTIVFPDGSKFTGACVMGRPHGRGVCKYASGELYDGEWVHGKRHGHGVGFFANGDSFVGDWEHNHVALNGRGRLTLADGTVHVYSQ